MNRRSFLATCAAACFISLKTRATTATNKRPHLQFPHSLRDRLAVSTYPFRGQMIAATNNRRNAALPGMTVLQFADFVKAEYGLAAIEVLENHFEATDALSLREFSAGLRQRGVTLVNIPLTEKTQLCNRNAQDHDAGMAMYRQWIDNAVLLDCPSLRMRVPMGADPKADIDDHCAVPALRELAAYASKRGVMLTLENDSPFNETASILVRVVQAVDSPWLRVLPDFANGLAAGDAAFNLREMQKLFPLAYNIAHAKSWETIDGVRKDIDLCEVLRVAEGAQYKGWYSLESDSRDDPKGDTHTLLNALLQCHL